VGGGGEGGGEKKKKNRGKGNAAKKRGREIESRLGGERGDVEGGG